jgi:hypothetical protein
MAAQEKNDRGINWLEPLNIVEIDANCKLVVELKV